VPATATHIPHLLPALPPPCFGLCTYFLLALRYCDVTHYAHTIPVEGLCRRSLVQNAYLLRIAARIVCALILTPHALGFRSCHFLLVERTVRGEKGQQAGVGSLPNVSIITRENNGARHRRTLEPYRVSATDHSTPHYTLRILFYHARLLVFLLPRSPTRALAGRADGKNIKTITS